MDTQKVSLKEALSKIDEFRQAQGLRYKLLSILLLACVAMMCGARSESAIAEWGRNYGHKWLRRLGIKRKTVPSQSTIHRVFKGIEVTALERVITEWSESILGEPVALEAIAIDGKTLRGAVKQGAQNARLLSAVSHRLATVLAQVAIPEGTNEISSMEELLEQLTLTGLVVTADALHTQETTAQAILDAGGDYVMVVKENQPTLLREVELVFETSTLAQTVSRSSSTTTHGNRIETRSIAASNALHGWSRWPGLVQVMKLDRTVITKTTGELRKETVYGITSLSSQHARPDQLNELWRKHWTIENKLHWVRDVTFDEDRSTVRSGNAPQAMAAIRNLAISLFRLRKEPNIAAAQRKYPARPALAFTALGI